MDKKFGSTPIMLEDIPFVFNSSFVIFSQSSLSNQMSNNSSVTLVTEFQSFHLITFNLKGLTSVIKIDFPCSNIFRENNFNLIGMLILQAHELCRRRHSMFTFYTLQLLQWLLGCQRPPALTYPQPVININAWPSS